MTAFLIVLQIVGLALIAFAATRRNVSPVLGISLFFTYALWFVIPVVTTLVAPERLADRLIVPVDDFVHYAVIETAAFLGTIFLFAIGGRSFRAIEDGRLARLTLSTRTLTAVAIGGALLHVAVKLRLLALMGASYQDINSFTVVGGASAGAVGILIFLDGVLPAIAASIAITPMPGMRVARVVVWLWILWIVFDGIRLGARLHLLTPCILLLMFLHMRRPRRAVIVATYAGIVAFFATVGVLLTLVIADIRVRGDISLSEVGRESKIIAGEESSGLQQHLWEFVDHLNIKFDSISSGAYLVEHFGVAQAKGKPYEGSLLAVIPRRVFPSKPVPGSGDGTDLGNPSRLVARAIGYDPLTGNVGVSPAATSIWQFGAVGVFLMIVLNALNLRLINALLLRPSIVTRTMAVFLISIPSFYGIFASADFHIMNAERVLALYAMGTVALHVMAAMRAPRFVAKRTAAA